jgi:hypothetical protein
VVKLDFDGMAGIKGADSFLKCCFLDFPSEYNTSNGNHQFWRKWGNLKEQFLTKKPS